MSTADELKDLVKEATGSGGSYGYQGNEDSPTSLSLSVPIPIMGNITYFATNSMVCAAIDNEGNLYTWGNAQNGRLGNGETSGQSSSPILILENVVQVGGNTTGGLAITGDGDLYIWGNPIYKYMDEPYTEPQLLLEGIVSASMGFQHLLALDTNGTVYAWGWNAYGQLGSGTTDSMQQPGEVQLFD